MQEEGHSGRQEQHVQRPCGSEIEEKAGEKEQ